VSEPTTTQDAQVAEAETPAELTAPEVLAEEELLVEDVSIDGMCGVY
jgi:mycofactocin precursor